MSKVKCECYLCRKEAEKFKEEASRSEIIKCSHCVNRYKITDRALRFRLKKKEGEEKLTEDDRLKLSKYVRTQDVKNDQPVLIDCEVIKKVTGKR